MAELITLPRGPAEPSRPLRTDARGLAALRTGE